MDEHRFSEHGRPLNFEQERRLVADVPGAIDAIELALRGPGYARQVDLALLLVKPGTERLSAEASRLLALAYPDSHAEGMAEFRERGDHGVVAGGARLEAVGADDCLGRAFRGAVTLEAGGQQRTVGGFVAGEDAGRPVENGRFGQRSEE